jgi:hypothetical protein
LIKKIIICKSDIQYMKTCQAILLLIVFCFNIPGCGKSEVDKCVEAKISSRAYEMCLVTNDFLREQKSCNDEDLIAGKKHIKSLREGEYREDCLRAHGK